MPTLTAPAAARAAAKRLGLAPPPSSKPPASPAEPKLPPQPATPAPAGNEDPAVAAPDAAPDAPSSKKAEMKKAWRAASQAARERLLPLLSARFPDVFKLPPVPLAIGIHKQILKVAGDDIEPAELGAFLRYWVRRASYLQAVWRGEHRRNLDGSIAGPPTIEQRNDAARRLWGKDTKRIVKEAEG